MIKTKSLFDPIDLSDGTRICVARRKGRSASFDEHIIELAPSETLLGEYKDKTITWKQYVQRFLGEMSYRRSDLLSLKKRSDSGETITLLCWEHTDDHCHRRLLKELIENLQGV